MKYYHEYVIDEILEIIKDNLILKYNYCDCALPNIRKYCNEITNDRYRKLDNQTAIYFVKEAINELINCNFLYDFRDLD